MEPGGGRGDSRALTAEEEEEAVKRNTDCVYFLASPLTCKKGNECEFRHSEGARVNPRDCWYWLNGSCLNPKCSFRHPPLDGLFGAKGTTTSGPPIPTPQTTPSTQIRVAHAPVYSSNKQSVPCIFFQKGYCLKGDRCPFMHGPQPAGNSFPQQMAKVSTSLAEQPQTFMNNSGSLKECTGQQNVLQQNFPKVTVNKTTTVPPPSVKPVGSAVIPPDNGLSQNKSLLSYQSGNKLPRLHPTHAPVNNTNSLSRQPQYQMHPIDECLQNGRELGEFFGEASQGYNVFVADKIKDNGRFHNEKDSAKSSVHGRQALKVSDDSAHSLSSYETVTRFRRDQYNGAAESEQYGKVQNHNPEKRRSSSERTVGRSLLPERVLQKQKSPDEMATSDLRHRLLKQRKLNGSRSVGTSDHHGDLLRRNDQHMGDGYLGNNSRRDELQLPIGSSVSSRLRGRISLPRGSLPAAPLSLQSDKERDREDHQGKVSPSRPASYQGRHHDKTKQGLSEDCHSPADVRNFGGQPTISNNVDLISFAGPKSLAELKGMKVVESSKEQPSKSISAAITLEQNGKAGGSQESEGSLLFEGPKPLSAILKRKRQDEPNNGADGSSVYDDNQIDGASSGCAIENNQRHVDSAVGNSFSEAVGLQPISASESNKGILHVSSHEGYAVVMVGDEGQIPTEVEDVNYDDQPSPRKDVLAEDLMEVDTEEGQEQQNSFEGDGEFDYEAIDAGDFKTQDDENAYQEDEEDLDDEDDFARKVGIIFS